MGNVTVFKADKPPERADTLNEAAGRYFERRDDESLQGVMEAASELIRFYSRLYGKTCDRDDLFQTGSLGLIKALNNFDPRKETSFVTYASHCIIGDIRHYVRKQASYYRPGCIVELQLKVDQVVEEYTKEHGDIPSISYISKKLNVKPESVDEVMKAGLVSFDEVDTSKIHSLAYESFRLPIEDRITLAQAMKKLSDVQRKIIHMLFYQGMTQEQVADKMGISQKKVSRIKQRSLEIMREDMEEKEENK